MFDLIRMAKAKGAVINLSDYGIDPFVFMESGHSSGMFTIQEMGDFWDRIPMNGERLVLFSESLRRPTIFCQDPMVLIADGMVHQVTFNATLMQSLGNDQYAIVNFQLFFDRYADYTLVCFIIETAPAPEFVE